MNPFSKRLTGSILVILGFAACNKSTVNLTPLSSLEIINSVPGSPGAQLSSNPNAVGYSSYGQFGLLAGNSAQVYVWPTGDSLHPYYNSSLAAVNGGIYSLYLISNNPQQNTLLLKDTIPSYTDSSMGIRFINLSPDAGPVNIDIAGTANGSTVPSLPYTSITSFNKFAANAANSGGYNFEIRNAADSLLTTYTQNIVYFKNVTIVINGMLADGSFAAFTVNNY
jgi:hypothetical protein